LEGSQRKISSLTFSFYAGVYSFTGFSYLNFVTEELKDPYRNLPRAIYISMPVVTLIYILVNVAYFAVLSTDEILESEAVAVSFANKAMGPLAPLMPIFVACSCFGCLNASSVAMLFFADVLVLINYCAFSESLVIAASVAGLVKLRLTRPDAKTPIKVLTSYKEPLRCKVFTSDIRFQFNICIPLIFLFLSCLFFVLPFFDQPTELMVGVVMVLSGIPVYILFVMNKNKPAFIEVPWIWFNHLVQKLLYCLPETEAGEK
uniref:S7A13 protein n=1 Tax=Angiostrongylus cantonensis TaxID=6313 RepID=A0A0K0DAH4_ANGCA